MAELKAGNFNQETSDSLDLKQICVEIFLKCDHNIETQIEISKLITFIAPFINSSEEHLSELKKILDPLNVDPKVNFDSFLIAMRTWTSKYCSKTNFVSNERPEIKRLSGELKQSTPIKENVEKGTNKHEFDGGLNISNISSYSYAGSEQSVCDPVFLNEQINELQHQNKKLLDSLNEVKNQLANSEEIISNMQTDYDRLRKSYQSDQKLLEDFQKMKIELEREREESNILMKNHNSVLISLNYYKKENSQLRKNILENETEIQKNQEIITRLQHKESKYVHKLEKYKKELEAKNSEISTLQMRLSEISAICIEKENDIEEKDNYIKEMSTELENVRTDNMALSKRVIDIYNENASFKPSKSDSESYPAIDSGTTASFEILPDIEHVKEESLQDELIKASNSDCIGPHTYCSHQLKIFQYEEDIENLQYRVQMQSNEILNISKIKANLESQVELLSSQNNSERDRSILLESQNETMNTLNQKLKSDIASMKNETKRFSRMELKIKKLEDEIFEEKTKSDQFVIQNNNLQKEKERISSELKQLESENHKILEKINAIYIECENMEKKLKENVLEKEKLLLENKNLGKDFKDLENKYLDLEERYSQKQINAINIDCGNMEKKLKESVLEKENLLLENKNLEKDFKDLENKYMDLEERCTQKHGQYENFFAEYQILQLNIKQLNQKNDELEKYIEDELSKEKAENLSLKTLLKSKVEHIIMLETEIKNIKHENNNLFILLNNEKIETETLIENLKSELKVVNQKLQNDVEKQLEKETQLQKLNNENKDLKNKNNELILQITDLSRNQELLEQDKKHLEMELSKLNLKLVSLTDMVNELTEKTSLLESEKRKIASESEKYNIKVEKLHQNIAKLEQKIQTLRKSSTDLSSSKSETEQFLKIIMEEKQSLVSHINFVQEQIQQCRQVLGQNTLNVSKLWKPDLDTIIPDFSIDELTDEASLSGIMKICEGVLTQDIKDLWNQTRLTGIMLKALAKIKQDEILQDEDVELSNSQVNEILVTTTIFKTNETSFGIAIAPPSSHSMSPNGFVQEDFPEEDEYATISLPISLPHLDQESEFPVPSGSNDYSVFDEYEEETEDIKAEKTDEEKPVKEKNDIHSRQKVLLKQVRSMSEGTAFNTHVSEKGDITLFPNLKDNVLESLGLQNEDDSRDQELEKLSEDELEANFQTLALIFAIDAKSITQRKELQRRQKDQADRNFHMEVERLEHGVKRLAPLCTDVETWELLQGVLKRITILVKAVQRISISTQIFGGVQQESRISSSVKLILLHLRNLHQQRDTLRRQLACTKLMLQESRPTPEPTSGPMVVSRRLGTSNSRVVTRRRASIASVPRFPDSPLAVGPQGMLGKKQIRRISADVYSEASRRPEWLSVATAGGINTPPPQIRLLRPSRIELNLDLMKISEGSMESPLNNHDGSDTEFITSTGLFPTPNLFLQHSSENFSELILELIRTVLKLAMYFWKHWFRNGTTRKITIFIILLFLVMLSIFTLNTMMISKLESHGTVIQRIPWSWLTWDEFWDLIFDVRIIGPRPY